jgi:hypothetical protein
MGGTADNEDILIAALIGSNLLTSAARLSSATEILMTLDKNFHELDEPSRPLTHHCGSVSIGT